MATLDTLSPQRRAIIELVLRRRQSYADVAAMLNMPTSRVRELAREALGSLAPATARRVDDEWRGQVADYVFGQQSGPEGTATRGHLKRSEPARMWVSSLLDSLDELYGDAERPEIPEPGPVEATGSRGRGGGGGRAGTAAAGAGAGAGLAALTQRFSGRSRTSGPPRVGGTTADAGTAQREQRPSRELSPAARAVVQRRRLIGAGVIGGIVVVVLVLFLVLRGGDDADTEKAGRSSPAQSQAAGGQQAQLVGQAELQRVGGGDAEGVAVIARRGGEFQLLVQARGLEPSGQGAAYEVWLYNSRRDAKSLGGQVTDNDGTLQGAGPLPPNFRDYELVDITREKIDDDTSHSGDSVLRVPVADLLSAQAAGTGAGAGSP